MFFFLFTSPLVVFLTGQGTFLATPPQAPDYALVSRSSGQLSLSVTLYEWLQWQTIQPFTFVKKQPLPPNVSNLNISGSLATGSNLVSATVSHKSQWILKSRSWIEFCKCGIKEKWISASRKLRQRTHHIRITELWVTEALAWVLSFNSG